MDSRIDDSLTAADDKIRNSGISSLGMPAEQPPDGFSLLGDLQPELLDMVLDHLESPSPSELKLHHRPDQWLTKCDAKSSKIYKNLSLTSTWMRRSTFRRLFKHVCLDPNELPEFLDFVYRNELGKYIESVTAIMTTSCKLLLHPLWWARLLNTIPVQTLTIVAPPTVFAEFMAPSSVNQIERDSQAHKMPFHAMTFYQSELSAMQHTDLNNDHDIFSARGWKSLTINEGSFYFASLRRPDLEQPEQYFLRSPPSIIYRYLVQCPSNTQEALAQLERFTYIAIYPFYNHIDIVLKVIRKMTNLTHLSFRICPVPGTNSFDANEKASLDREPDDVYSEVTTSYSLIAHTARAMCVDGALQVLEVKNYMTDIAEPLADVITSIIGSQRMTWAGPGIWQRVETVVKSDPHTLSDD